MFTPPDVPGYVIGPVLGQGGFGAVYLATQIAVGRDVAVKIDNRLVTSERDQRRFFREVNSAGRLSDHPHVVGLYDAGTLSDGRPYLVMELCSGGSLADLLRQQGSLSPAEVRDIGLRIADALGAAHRLGVLHRDIKPGNILINQYGTVGLADFGLASILAPDREQSATREALTPAFAAPEAFALAEPAAAADVYSLGATLYALLAGRPPRFPDSGSPSIPTLLQLHHEPVPVLPWVPSDLMDVLLRSLAYDPCARYPDGSALRDALAETLLPQPEPAAPVPAGAAFPSRSSVPTGFGLTGSGPANSGFPGSRFTGERFRTGPPSAPVPRRSEPGAPAGPKLQSWASSTVFRIAVAALLVVGVTVGTLVIVDPFGSDQAGPGRPSNGAQLPSPTESEGQANIFGVDTTTDGCAAVGSDGTGGRCTTEAECWSGQVVIVGKVEITRLPCEDRHRWETFAIAELPADALTSNQQTLAAHPTVKQLCTKKLLLKSRRGQAQKIPARRWAVDVLPPSEKAYQEGARVYRCIGAVITPGAEGSTGTAFTRP